MRWLIVVAAFATLVSGGVNASEPVAVSMPVTETAAPILIHDLAPPAAVAPRPSRLRTAPEIRPGDKPKIAKKSKLNKSMLSRTARSQMALAAVKSRPESVLALDLFNEDDAGSGIDNLDLHRFFSRPRVVETEDQEDEELEISDHVKLRLFLARMKAVEAHKAAQARAADQAADADDGLSEAVKLRLFLARMKAIQAHQKKFS